jgi:hypothetical protein
MKRPKRIKAAPPQSYLLSARLERANDFLPANFKTFHLTSPGGALLATGHMHLEVAEKLEKRNLVKIKKGVVCTRYEDKGTTPDQHLRAIHAALIEEGYIGIRDPNNSELLDVTPLHGRKIDLSKSVAKCPRAAMVFMGFVVKSTLCVVHDEMNGQKGVWIGDAIYNPDRPKKLHTKDVPGGTVSARESYLLSFFREVFQEIGVRLKSQWFNFLGPVRMSRTDFDGRAVKHEHILVFGFNFKEAKEKGWIDPDFQLKATEHPAKTSAWSFYPIQQILGLLESDDKTLSHSKAISLAYGMWKLGLLTDSDLEKLNSKHLPEASEEGMNGSVWQQAHREKKPIRYRIPRAMIRGMVVRTRPRSGKSREHGQQPQVT